MNSPFVDDSFEKESVCMDTMDTDTISCSDNYGDNKSGDFFVHGTAVVDEGARIGTGTRIWHFSHVSADAVIGQNCNLGQNVFVATGVVVGNGCKIQNNVSLYSGVHLQDQVFCGPSCVFTNDYLPRANTENGWQITDTLVEYGASIGANATIVCGNTIGRFALVGSGSVVTHDVKPHALVVGVPARQIGWVCECGSKLEKADDEYSCPECKKRYQEYEGQLQVPGLFA